jgi:hypothetical protein
MKGNEEYYLQTVFASLTLAKTRPATIPSSLSSPSCFPLSSNRVTSSPPRLRVASGSLAGSEVNIISSL